MPVNISPPLAGLTGLYNSPDVSRALAGGGSNAQDTDRQGRGGTEAAPASLRLSGPELTGHYVRITPSGGKTFSVVARAPNGKQVWAAIGAADAMPIEEARKRARAAIGRIRDG